MPADELDNYWHTHYVNEEGGGGWLCQLCRDSGVVRTVHGYQNYCLCPTGRQVRKNDQERNYDLDWFARNYRR